MPASIAPNGTNESVCHLDWVHHGRRSRWHRHAETCNALLTDLMSPMSVLTHRPIQINHWREAIQSNYATCGSRDSTGAPPLVPRSAWGPGVLKGTS